MTIEIENLPREDLEIGSVDEGSSDHSVGSPVCCLMDYLDLEIEESILIEENLITLREKYDIPKEYEMLVPGSKDRISESPEGYIAFYDEALRFRL